MAKKKKKKKISSYQILPFSYQISPFSYLISPISYQIFLISYQNFTLFTPILYEISPFLYQISPHYIKFALIFPLFTLILPLFSPFSLQIRAMLVDEEGQVVRPWTPNLTIRAYVGGINMDFSGKFEPYCGIFLYGWNREIETRVLRLK
jgi:hypothetical protein